MARRKKKTVIDAADHIPSGVEAVSTRTAAEILGCYTGSVRKLVSLGRLGERGRDWFRVSPRSLLISMKAVQRYAKEVEASNFGRPRQGFSIDQ